MKHLRIFNSMEEFEAVKALLDTPYIVMGGGKIIASNLPTITEDDITDGEYIDLGLPSGLKWASCNLGAEKPCDYGKYFQWGDTVGYTDGSHASYQTAPFNNGSDDFDYTYFDANMSQWLDGDILKPEYDAVSVATGGKAHMPTSADFDELLSGTTNEWCQCVVLGDDHKEHNVYGRLFTSKVNGNRIFIPTAGFALTGSLKAQGSYAFLWSSSLVTSNHEYALDLQFRSGNCYVLNTCCAYGLSVRGVKS